MPGDRLLASLVIHRMKSGRDWYPARTAGLRLTKRLSRDLFDLLQVVPAVAAYGFHGGLQASCAS